MAVAKALDCFVSHLVIISKLSQEVYYSGLVLYPIYFLNIMNYSFILSSLIIAIHGIGTLIGRKMMIPLIQNYSQNKVIYLCIILSAFSSIFMLKLFSLNYYQYIMAIAAFIRGFSLGI
ncbi:hypothetical protein [Acinetobacter sp. c1-l78]|uniref:hypothetical protein n=1 Tax=Acinetobacter sp. c1-l78 TaxID=3342803 RepID=UPI0035BB931B